MDTYKCIRFMVLRGRAKDICAESEWERCKCIVSQFGLQRHDRSVNR